MLRELERRQPPLSRTTVRYAYVVLRVALGRALKLGKVHRNVATLIDPPAKARREVQPMAAAEARAFLESVDGDRLEVLYRLAMATGMRQGELLALRWQDVDLDRGWLEVRHTLVRGTRELAPPKTEQARRRIALDGDTLAMLRAHRITQASIRVPEHDRDFVSDPRRTAVPCTQRAACVSRGVGGCWDAASIVPPPQARICHPSPRERRGAGQHLKGARPLTFATTVDFYGHLTPGVSRRAADRWARSSRAEGVREGVRANKNGPPVRRRAVSRSKEWLARKDSNLQSPDPESGALPFGHSPARITGYQIAIRPPLGRPAPEPGTLVALGQARPPHLETPCPRSSTASNAAR